SITNWTIDINNTPGIPAGTYRLGVWVDSNNDVSESDENNNAGLLAGNINYTPSSSGISSSSLLANSIDLFPNPSNDRVKMNFTLGENSAVSLNIYDLTGKLIRVVNDKEEMIAGTYSLDIETADLPSGVYFMTLSTGELSVTRRLTVVH
ncbi:MAG TPA: T9SS type A sorting domain-containing protein, partial [Bacteroidia bacterium]|nr:T9SS type A sorting domain-containing protein [Bacteroidia bacterium]